MVGGQFTVTKIKDGIKQTLQMMFILFNLKSMCPTSPKQGKMPLLGM